MSSVASTLTTQRGLPDKLQLCLIAVERTRMPMVITDVRQNDNPIVFANGAYLELTGYPAEEIIGVNPRRFQGPLTDPDTVAAIRRCVHEAHVGHFELVNYRKDTTTFWNNLFLSPIVDDDGQLAYYFGSSIDISERRDANARLVKSQSDLVHVSRLSAMGTMASTIAHELNQPLTAATNFIRGSLGLLAADPLRLNTSIVDALADAEQSILRAGEIIRRLRSFVTIGDIQRSAENIAKIVEDACAIALIDADTLNIRYSVRLLTKPMIVFVDSVQIQQVLVNLIRNAVEAVQQVTDRQINVSVRAVESLCEVSVQDTGRGVQSAVAGQLFEPFSTTKQEGMGIGLSISRTIIEAHGGRVWSQNSEQGGAIFRFTLPLSIKTGRASNVRQPGSGLG